MHLRAICLKIVTCLKNNIKFIATKLNVLKIQLKNVEHFLKKDLKMSHAWKKHAI